MANSDDSMLDKAESLARRLLERLGANVDSSGSQSDQTLSLRRVGEITSQLEKSIEANLREDKKGVRRIAPNSFDVLLIYEEASHLNTKYIEALAAELKSAVFEYINNRRYETEAPVLVSVRSDLFAKSSVIKATFNAGAEKAQAEAKPSARSVTLKADNGLEHRINLKQGGEPQYIGRGAGVALRIDDASVSRLHCSVSLRAGGEVILSDLGSANGTAVNGRSLGEGDYLEIKKGDSVEVGDVSLIVVEVN